MLLTEKLNKQFQRRPFIHFGFLAVILVLMHLHVFERDLVGVHVWRQTQTQTNVLNFAYDDATILNPKSFSLHHEGQLARYEFPYMQWIFSLFYRVFGDHIIISRLLSFIIALFSIGGFYKLLKIIFTNSFTIVAGTWAFSFSPVFYYYMVNPLPDNMALCMSIWFLVYFFKFVDSERKSDFIVSVFFLLLATLAKLPFVLYGSCIALFILKQFKKRPLNSLLNYCFIFMLIMLPAFMWYIWVIPQWKGNGVIMGMANNEKKLGELLTILQSNLISTLPELLINYASCLFFVLGLYLLIRRKLLRNEKVKYLAIAGLAFILYFLFEMNMIGTVHDYYLFPFLPLIFLIVTFGIDALLKQNKNALQFVVLFLLMLLPLTAFLRINTRWNLEEPGFNVDLLKNKQVLRNAVPSDALCICGNDKSAFIWNYYLRKKCWSFSDDKLEEEYFNLFLQQGATYFYSDSREVESLPFVKPHLGNLVLECNSIRVYKLNP